MKKGISIAFFVAMANAYVGRSDSCCFQLTASGGASGSLGQLNDGQVRVGDDSLSAAEFCLSNSVIIDSDGRGCVITTETTQFQCDDGATGTSGFSLTSSGLLKFDGRSSFIACQTGENNGRNIYTTNSTDVTDCVGVRLSSNSCYAAVASPSSHISPASSFTPSSSSSTPLGVSPGVPSASPVTSSHPLIPTTAISQASSTFGSSTATSVSKTTGASTVSESPSGASTAPIASSEAGYTFPADLAYWITSFLLLFGLMGVY